MNSYACACVHEYLCVCVCLVVATGWWFGEAKRRIDLVDACYTIFSRWTNQTMNETCIQMTSLALANVETLPHIMCAFLYLNSGTLMRLQTNIVYDKVMFISMIMKYGCSKRCSTLSNGNEICWRKEKCLAQYYAKIADGSNSTHRHTHSEQYGSFDIQQSVRTSK